MLRSTFDQVLLRTAFSFMTCDSHIDRKELICILEMTQDKYLFDCIEIEYELEKMLDALNLRGTDYLKDYFRKVDRLMLTEVQQIQVIRVAVDIICADTIVKESEIKFLQILRTLLNTPDHLITSNFPKLAKDFIGDDEFTEGYIKRLSQNYFKHRLMTSFNISDVLDMSYGVLQEIES